MPFDLPNTIWKLKIPFMLPQIKNEMITAVPLTLDLKHFMWRSSKVVTVASVVVISCDVVDVVGVVVVTDAVVVEVDDAIIVLVVGTDVVVDVIVVVGL